MLNYGRGRPIPAAVCGFNENWKMSSQNDGADRNDRRRGMHNRIKSAPVPFGYRNYRTTHNGIYQFSSLVWKPLQGSSFQLGCHVLSHLVLKEPYCGTGFAVTSKIAKSSRCSESESELVFAEHATADSDSDLSINAQHIQASPGAPQAHERLF
jgi:hypothetical protein